MNFKTFAIQGFFQRRFGTVCEVAPEADANSGRGCIKVATLKILNGCGLTPVPVVDAFSRLIQVLFPHYFCCSPISVTHSICAGIGPS